MSSKIYDVIDKDKNVIDSFTSYEEAEEFLQIIEHQDGEGIYRISEED